MKIIISFLKPFWKSIIFIVFLTFGQVIADLLLPNYMAHIVDEGIAKNNTSFILHSGIEMLIIALCGACCAVGGGYLASRSALGVGKNIRASLFGKVTGFSLSEQDRFGTSSLITRTTNDVQQIQNTSFMMLRMMMRAPIMCIGGIIMAVEKNRELSLILLGILPIVIIIIFLVTKKAMPLFRIMQKKLDQLNLVMRENLVGIRIIRAFSKVGYEKKRFASANDDLTNTSIKVNRIMAVLNPSMMLTMNLLTIAIVWFASFRIDKGMLQVGDMMAFIQYAIQIFMSLMMVTMMFVMLPRAFASAERINDVLKTESKIKDPDHAEKINDKRGLLVFKDVTFRYDKAENPSVCDASFTACPGETIAIIGGTGAGKTSLVNLMLRFYDIEKGTITIDGVDIRQMKQKDIRDKIGYVPQKAILFSGSINENIRMGKQDASDEEIMHACQIAQATEFIEQLPEKYNSFISQGGTNLSGGQRQRLCIARALVKKPEIYIFDDSFSALDFKTDAALQKALKTEIQNSTIILVAQRVTSIKHADKIIVMDNGRIAGIGKHQDLLNSNEIYREIVMSQLSEEEIN